MKKLVLAVLVTLSLLSLSTPATLYAAGEEEVTVHSFFEQLQNGTAEGVLSQLTDPIWQKKREIFYKNPQYIEHLHGIYQGSSISITNNETISDHERRVYVEVYLTGEDIPLKTSFIVKKMNGDWKISKELLLL